MLKIESKSLEQQVDASMRVSMLEKLGENGLLPMIYAARQTLFELAMMGEKGAKQLEQSLIHGSGHDAPYVRGDLFCFEDFVYFLIFGDRQGGDAGLRAGIICHADMEDAAARLDAFCHNVSESLIAAQGVQDTFDDSRSASAAWQVREPRVSESFSRFAAAQGGGVSTPSVRGEMVADWLRAVGMLENLGARRALRRLTEAYREGRTTALSISAGEREGMSEGQLSKLVEVGLIRREILVSCRKDGRALFRLPSPDAFSVLTASYAVCSECGTALSDEKAEEIAVPTPLASTLLQDGTWLTSHLRSILIELGLPEEQIAERSISEDGEMQMMTDVAGAPFLFLLRDGDWTAGHVRRSIGEYLNAGHLVIIATGRIHDDARLRLRESARRGSGQGGGGTDVIMVEGMETVAAELQEAFERAAQQALTEELWELDASLGFGAGRLLAARFRLLRLASAAPPAKASASSA